MRNIFSEFNILRNQPPGSGGEIQLADAIHAIALRHGVDVQLSSKTYWLDRNAPRGRPGYLRGKVVGLWQGGRLRLYG